MCSWMDQMTRKQRQQRLRCQYQARKQESANKKTKKHKIIEACVELQLKWSAEDISPYQAMELTS